MTARNSVDQKISSKWPVIKMSLKIKRWKKILVKINDVDDNNSLVLHLNLKSNKILILFKW